MVRSGELSAPIVIGRDHLDSGSVASPNRETEAMQDGSDAVSDWPLLNALLNTASGATWVSLHHGGGVGMGFSQHSGMVIVCDGSDEAAERIARVLTNDPGTGVMRHADAGYQVAIDCAKEQGLNLPMITSSADLETASTPAGRGGRSPTVPTRPQQEWRRASRSGVQQHDPGQRQQATDRTALDRLHPGRTSATAASTASSPSGWG